MVDFTTSLNARIRSIDKIYRNMQRARDNNAYVLPDYGSGPSAGKTVPTVAVSATALSGKTAQFGLNDPEGQGYCAIYGGIATAPPSGSIYPVLTVTSNQGQTDGTNFPNRSGNPWAIEFMTDDDGVSFQTPVIASQGKFRVLVDGQFVSRTAALVTGTGNPYINISFGSRSQKGRLVRIEMEWPNKAGRVYVAPTATLWKPTPPDFVRWPWIGDSWARYDSSITPAGTGAAYFGHDNYAMGVMRNIGVTDAISLGVGSTGFASDQDAINVRYSSRLNDLAQYQALAGGIDGVTLQGSINDQNKSPATIIAEVVKCIAGVRAIIGVAAPIIVTGVPNGALGTGGGIAANVLAAENAVIAGVQQAADPMTAFVPFSTRTRQPILTGDNANGNAQFYFADAEQYHPTGGVLSAAPVSKTNGGFEYIFNAATEGFRTAITALRK